MNRREWNRIQELADKYDICNSEGLNCTKAEKLFNEINELVDLYKNYANLSKSGLPLGIPYIHDTFGIVLSKSYKVTIPTKLDEEITLAQVNVVTSLGKTESVEPSTLKPYTVAGQILYKKD